MKKAQSPGQRHVLVDKGEGIETYFTRLAERRERSNLSRHSASFKLAVVFPLPNQQETEPKTPRTISMRFASLRRRFR